MNTQLPNIGNVLQTAWTLTKKYAPAMGAEMVKDRVENDPLVNTFIYNKDTQRAFPNSPVWKMTGRPEDTKDLAMSVGTMMAGVQPTSDIMGASLAKAVPQVVNTGKLMPGESPADFIKRIQAQKPVAGGGIDEVWNPAKPTLKADYDKALSNGDMATVKRLEPEIPASYRKSAPTLVNHDPLLSEAKTPETTRVWIKSKLSNKGDYADIPVIRKEDNITLYQGKKMGENRQFWTPNKKYAEQFGDVTEKTGAFYKVDNGNRMTDVYVEAKPQTIQSSPLIQEAKKYKSAEEFVKQNTLFHGTGEGAARSIQREGLKPNQAIGATGKGDYANIFLSQSEDTAKSFATRKSGGGYLLRVAKTSDIVPDMKRVGRGKLQDFVTPKDIPVDNIEIQMPDGRWTPIKNYDFYDRKPINGSLVDTTKSQLTDIWNKAQGLPNITNLIK